MSKQADPVSNSGRAERGFTLIEVLVASALLLMVSTLLLSVTSNTTSIASKTTEQIDATRVAREAFDLMGRDLALTTLPWSRSNANSLQFLVNPTLTPAIDSSFTNRDTMFWQAPLARTVSNGNFSIIGYFVLRDAPPYNQNSRFQLRRMYIEPTSTNGDYNLYNASTPWLASSMFASFAPKDVATDNQNALKGWVADGVIGMWIQCLDRVGNVIYSGSNARSFNSRDGKFTASDLTYTSPANYSYSRLPAFVEVTLVCMAPREISKLVSLPNALTFDSTTVANFVTQVRTANPGVKSVGSFDRKFSLKNSD